MRCADDGAVLCPQYTSAQYRLHHNHTAPTTRAAECIQRDPKERDQRCQLHYFKFHSPLLGLSCAWAACLMCAEGKVAISAGARSSRRARTRTGNPLKGCSPSMSARARVRKDEMAAEAVQRIHSHWDRCQSDVPRFFVTGVLAP